MVQPTAPIYMQNLPYKIDLSVKLIFFGNTATEKQHSTDNNFQCDNYIYYALNKNSWKPH